MLKEFSNIFSSGPVVLFKWNVDSSYIENTTDNLFEIFRIHKEDVIFDKYFIYEVIKKEDLNSINLQLHDCFKEGRKSVTLKPFKIYIKKEKISWIKLHFNIEYNSEKNPIFFIGYAIDVSKEFDIKKKLIESEAKYRAISEYSTDVIFIVNRAGKILYINKPVKEATGIDPAEVIGKSFRKHIPKKEIPRYLSKLTKVFLGNEVRNFRTYAYNANKELIPVEISGKLINYEGKKVGLGFVRNVSEQENFENELKKLSSAVEFSVNGVLITDSNWKVEYLNHKYSEISGYNYEDLIGKKINIFQDKMTVLFDEMSKSVRNKGEWHGEFRKRKKNGKSYWVHIAIAPIFGNKKNITNFIVIAQDITDRIEAEKNLIISKEKAEESDRLKTAFLANMSHEIRTPLNAILGFAQFLDRKDLEFSERKKYADIIIESGNHLLELINNIVDISKLEAGQVDINNVPIDIEDLFKELYLFFQPSIHISKIELSYKMIENQLKKEFISDKTRLKQIFINLISNAIKFTKQGYVKFSGTYNIDNVLFKIEDTGIGIPESNKKDIFERFRQAHKISEEFGGTGLGLSIVKENVNILGGTIWLESKINKGSSFYIELPYNSSGKKS